VSRRVLALPSPEPAQLALKRRPPRAFPIVDPRTRYFHLARGAVFQAIRDLELDGADVLVPAWHHGVEVEALVAAGARPVFYGLHPDLSADVASLAKALTPATRGLYVIHYLGLPQPMQDLLAFARGHGLRVLEDCALALFSADGAVPLGTRGDASVWCLYKTLPVPDGGALWMPRKAVDDAREAPSWAASIQGLASGLVNTWTRRSIQGARVRESLRGLSRGLRRVARLPGDRFPVGHARYVPGEERLGLPPLTAWMLDRVDARPIVERRRRNFLDLDDRLGPVAQRLFTMPDGMTPLFYPLIVEDKARVRRQLEAVGIETVDFWRHGSPLVPRGRFPVTDHLREHLLELPIHQDVEPADVAHMAREVRRALGVKGPSVAAVRDLRG
jgi:dTDP-4-amino-4,6-dideoxygalactose transaminase